MNSTQQMIQKEFSEIRAMLEKIREQLAEMRRVQVTGNTGRQLTAGRDIYLTIVEYE